MINGNLYPKEPKILETSKDVKNTHWEVQGRNAVDSFKTNISILLYIVTEVIFQKGLNNESVA